MKKLIIIFCFIFLMVFSVFAETINLENARLLALANSRSLAKYDLAIQSSLLDEKSQLYSMLPVISAGYTASMSYISGNWVLENPLDTFKSGINFSITQKIFEGGKSLIQRALNSISTESVRKDALAEYFNVLDAADNAYYAVLEAAASLEAEESSLQTAILSLSIAEIRQANGMINQGDYMKALADKESRENSRNQSRRNLALITSRFKALTGITETVQLEQIDFNTYEVLINFLAGISDDEADALYNRFWRTLTITNPSLAKAALNNERAEKNLTIAKRGNSPVISATIFGTGFNYTSAGGFSSTASGGISISGSIPVDFWVTANRIEKSRISQASAALDFIGTTISLEMELQSALLNVFAQAGSVMSSRRSLEYIEKHFEYVMERYRLSQSSVSDLGDASTMLINSRNSHIRASYGFLQSLSKLRSLSAIDDEEKLMEIFLGN